MNDNHKWERRMREKQRQERRKNSQRRQRVISEYVSDYLVSEDNSSINETSIKNNQFYFGSKPNTG